MQFADRDAVQFAEAIKRAGVDPANIRLLTGAAATASAIKTAIGTWLARSASERDTVYIFYSGHGLVERDFKQGYLLGSDSDTADPYATAVSLSDLKHILNERLRAGRILFIADSIRRDIFQDSPEASTVYVEEIRRLAASRQGITAVLASGAGEFSREGNAWGGQGVFAKHLVDAFATVSDTNGDGLVTFDEAFEYVSSKVVADTSNKQHPFKTEQTISQFVIARASLAKAQPVQERPAAVATVRPQEKEQESPPPARTEQPVVAEQPPTAKRVEAEKRQAPAVETQRPDDRKKEEPPIVARAEPEPSPSSRPTQPDSPVKTPEPISSVSTPAAVDAAANKPVTAEPVRTAPPPPRKPASPPETTVVVGDSPTRATVALNTNVPASAGPAPSPLILQMEAAIVSGNLVEPQAGNAWELFQRLQSDQTAAADLARLRPQLASALAKSGRAIIEGDVRSDNIADKVNDFKRAGQMITRARSIQPAEAELAALEKVSAAQALIALQFYDEAERALTQIQGARTASMENALGLVYQGKLDTFRAERAFKRASELQPDWSVPYYNLGLLYRQQRADGAVESFERAATLDGRNVSAFTALGDEYFTREMWEKAVEAYRKAVALKPMDESLRTKLGHALYSHGQRDEANKEYQKAKELRAKTP